MKLITDWYKQLESLCDQYDGVLVTQNEFEDALKNLIIRPNSPIDAIDCKITSNLLMEDISIGSMESKEETDSFTYDLQDGHRSQCKIRLEREAGTLGFGIENIKSHLIRFINCFWKPEMRDERSGLPALQNPNDYQIVDSSVSRFTKDYNVLCIFFCDLDKFKAVNDTFDMATGDRVILEFASLLDETVRPDGVVLHRSGDEFVVLFPADLLENGLFLAKNIMEEVTNYDFNVGDLKVGVSAGIAVLEQGAEFLSYKELEQQAEKAVKPDKEPKRRGKARLAGWASEVTLPKQNSYSRSLALCIMKSNLVTPRPFESPWLNMISQQIYSLLKNKHPEDIDVGAAIDNIVNWIQPEFDNEIMRSALSSEESGDFAPIFSFIDIVLAAAHGIFRSYLASGKPASTDEILEIRYNDKGRSQCQLRLLPRELVLIQLGDIAEFTAVWNLGNYFSSTCQIDTLDPISCRRALLIKIGHIALDIPNSIFAEIIIVDDRPSRGGGLPDFWEATIAKLAAHIARNPNIAGVYILGNHKHGARTIAKLKDVCIWQDDIEQIAYRTGMSVQNISTAASLLLKKMHFPESGQELVDRLANVLQSHHTIQPTHEALISQRSTRFLHRELRMDDMSLGREDGCRTGTISEAYPVVLDIVRKANEEEAIIRDQAGQELKELIDFKVHLTNPCEKLIPAFYEQERDSLENYYKTEFEDKLGLFGQVFEESGQLQAVLEHLTNSIGNPDHQFATRRAVLIVPHEVGDNDEDLTPLGLTSVRIIPRFIGSHICLHYSYVWRTVEALVGFPYSIYGSVRYSQHLNEMIQERLPSDCAKQLRIGTVSYIARSLHIFTDDYGQNIVRRIIDDATI